MVNMILKTHQNAEVIWFPIPVRADTVVLESVPRQSPSGEHKATIIGVSKPGGYCGQMLFKQLV